MPLTGASVPSHLETVAIEDERFYEHGGIDPEGILRAGLADIEAGEVVEGGSTITQQLVKLTRIEAAENPDEVAAAQEETKARKVEELRYAIWVEEHLTKDEILERYLNTAYYGDGAYGIQAAARHYFSVNASVFSDSSNGISYLEREAITRSRGNIVLPFTTVAGATALTRTSGDISIASSRTRWLAAALLVSYARLPFFATTALALVVRTMFPFSPCFLKISFASSATM